MLQWKCQPVLSINCGVYHQNPPVVAVKAVLTNLKWKNRSKLPMQPDHPSTVMNSLHITGSRNLEDLLDLPWLHDLSQLASTMNIKNYCRPWKYGNAAKVRHDAQTRLRTRSASAAWGTAPSGRPSDLTLGEELPLASWNSATATCGERASPKVRYVWKRGIYTSESPL